MILLTGLSDEKVQEIITTETTTGNTLFYSLEKWRPGCRAKNRIVWLQLWGFPIEAWELKHLKTAVSIVGDVIEPDDDTEDRRRLDRARLLIQTPLPPAIRKEVKVCVDGIMHNVWMVEEVGGEGSSNPRRPSLSDTWSEEVTSEEGELEDDVDEDGDSRFSFTPELTSRKPIPGSIHWLDDKTSGHGSATAHQLTPLGINQPDHAWTDGPEDIPNNPQSPKSAKVDSVTRREEKAEGSCCTTGEILVNEKAAFQEHEDDIVGINLNCDAGGSEAQVTYGEILGDIRHTHFPSTLLSPQNQSCIGPNCSLGPTREQFESKKDGPLPIVHIPKVKSDMHPKVYVRQKFSKAKAHILEPVEEEPQIIKGDNGVETMSITQDKGPQQSKTDPGRGIKSKIQCNSDVLDEAHQQWNLGTILGLEAATDQSIHIQNFANMEVRDREEAMKMGNRKTADEYPLL